MAGGAGSVHADLDSLEALAGRHAEAGERAAVLAMRTQALSGDLDEAVPVAPSAARLREGLDGASAAFWSLAERLRATGRAVSAAVERYREAEAGADGVVDAVDLDPGTLGAWHDRFAADGLTAAEVEWLLRQGPELLLERQAASAAAAAVTGALVVGTGGTALPVLGASTLAGFLTRHAVLKPLLAQDALPMVDAVLDAVPGEQGSWGAVSEVGAWAVAQTERASVEPVAVTPAGDWAPAELDGGVGDVVDLIPRAGLPPGSVTVTRVAAADGDVWVVGLPGTQGAVEDPGGAENWADWLGTMEAYGGGSERVGAGVAAALESAGVPDGATLVLSGYSAGGLHAVNLVRHPAVAARWEVGGVVTVGTPLGEAGRAEGVPVLSFERDLDVVAGLDGGPNPTTAEHVTVTFRERQCLAPPAPRGGAEGPGVVEGVARGVELLEGAGADPGPAAWAPTLVAAGRHHALELYRQDVRAYDAAPSWMKEQEAAQLARVSALTAGAVRESTVVTMRRRGTPGGPRHPMSEPVTAVRP